MKLSEIKNTFSVRNINQAYVEFLSNEFSKNGYSDAHPVSITDDGMLWDGNHRLAAAIKAGLEEIPHITETPENIRKAAHDRNRTASNALPETFVDHAEEIWTMLNSGMTQQAVADELGWSVSKVKQYSLLQGVCKEAWQKVTENIRSVTVDESGAVTEKVTSVTFSEGLLRSITSLKPDQQTGLVSRLAKNNGFSKADFKKAAERYRTENEIEKIVLRSLEHVDDESKKACIEASKNGIYIREFESGKEPGPKLKGLIQSYIDGWEKKTSFKLFTGSFVSICSEQIEPESIDYIITDPPYKREFLGVYRDLGLAAEKVLKPGGSLIAMVGQSYLPEIISMLSETLTYHWTVAYLTPGGQSVQLFRRNVNTFWKPLLWFVKGEYGGKWIGDVTKSAVNDNDKRFHEWGQSESGMLDIVKRFTEPGEIILDPFCGAATTGIAALASQRKFIGIDISKEHIENATRRLSNGLQ